MTTRPAVASQPPDGQGDTSPSSQGLLQTVPWLSSLRNSVLWPLWCLLDSKLLAGSLKSVLSKRVSEAWASKSRPEPRVSRPVVGQRAELEPGLGEQVGPLLINHSVFWTRL